MRNNIQRTADRRQGIILGIYIVCYFLVNITFLVDFPFVHSDEAWLSGLTRNMMETGNLGTTETFFDLMPRHPHAIKILFHILQMPLLALFSYQIFSVRLLSLIFGCITLIIFYFLLKTYFMESNQGSQWRYPILGTVFLSLDVQFIYASHFARQEIILVCCIVSCILALSRNHYLIAGLITGLSIGLHPNSFLIGTMCGVILIPFARERLKHFAGWKPLLGYSAVTSFFALVFISISLTFDRDFFRHYLAYGNSEFDIGAPITGKLSELPYFIKKIWYGVSGTYYVPDIRFEFILFAIAAVVAIFLLLSGKSKRQTEIALIVKGIIGLLVGMVIIGRYNQTSIIFLFPLFFALILLTINNITIRSNNTGSISKCIPIFILILVTSTSCFFNITPWLKIHYEEYSNELAKAVVPQSKVLANLNSEFYFDNGKLLDYRNLSYLKEKNMTIEDYVKKNKIEYIALSDEMDLIYSQRPVWNMIYGNLRYMEELHQFLDQNCTLVHSFRNNTYGIRIIQYMDSDRNFTVKIYKVKDSS